MSAEAAAPEQGGGMLPAVTDPQGLSVCDPTPEVADAWPSSLILLDSHQKGIH